MTTHLSAEERMQATVALFAWFKSQNIAPSSALMVSANAIIRTIWMMAEGNREWADQTASMIGNLIVDCTKDYYTKIDKQQGDDAA